jgi:holo-[acyl-carrier protein] synthase
MLHGVECLLFDFFQPKSICFDLPFWIMGILGCGVDIVHLPRIYKLLTRRSPVRFGDAILTTSELQAFQQQFQNQPLASRFASSIDHPNLYANNNNLSAPVAAVHYADYPALERRIAGYLGGRWAVKEAAYKALFPHFRLEWGLVSVVSQNSE